ncbi:MAG TPA: helix-turn-helix transcriptional regulator [Saprospiraceae bacterium]|nr:helix-turn-helix transcriptional regulator [Saprospiraceae bacterium]
MEYNNIINEFWEAHGDPETERFVDLSMDIIDEIHNALEKKGWSQKDLATAVGKSPGEISKWVSGLHNLTLKSIVKLESALETNLLFTETTAKEKFGHSEHKMIIVATIPNHHHHIPEYKEVGERNPLKVVYQKAS